MENRVQASIGGGGSTPVRRRRQFAVICSPFSFKTAGFLWKSAAETKNERGDSTKVRRPGRSAVYAQIYQEAFRTPGIWPL